LSASLSAADFACIVDASVLVKLVLPEDGSAAATALMHPTEQGDPPRRVVPDLIYHECANILWKRVRRGEFSAAVAETRLGQLLSLPLSVWAARDLVLRALALASSLGLSAYDAAYVALAELLGVPLITADTALAQKARAGGHDVRLLGEIDSAGSNPS